MNTENINIEDIKVGETYNVRVKVLSVENGNRIITRTVGEKNKELSLCATNFFKEELPAFSHVSPAPKYDPCRKFRKGDKVRVVKWHGRACSKFWEPFVGMVMDVVESEDDCMPEVRTPKGWQPIDPPYLELVTPVEELEPYRVKFLQAGEVPDTYYYWAVMDNMGHEVARFWHEQYEKGQAEASAEAECARLNSEYRKEQSHD